MEPRASYLVGKCRSTEWSPGSIIMCFCLLRGKGYGTKRGVSWTLGKHCIIELHPSPSALVFSRHSTLEKGISIQFWNLSGREDIKCFLKISHHRKTTQRQDMAISTSLLLSISRHRGWASLWHWICGGKEQIFPRLFPDTAEWVGGNTESKGVHLHATATAPHTSPGKQTDSQMHWFLSWNIKREG